MKFIVDRDRLMKRTMARPLPSNKISISNATIFGISNLEYYLVLWENRFGDRISWCVDAFIRC